jgi:hypothetical protein
MTSIRPSSSSVIAVAILLAGTLLAACGCAPTGRAAFDLDKRYVTTERAAKGLVVILPGIEGEDQAPHDVRDGLYKAGIPYALVVYRWGAPVPGVGMLINQTDVARNRRQGEEIASQIATYQQKHPGAPVFMIGHSAGGGVTVFTLEALGRITGAKPIDGAFLLSSSLSANYDLTGALNMTRRGIVNVSNSDDTLVLGAGTAAAGNVDGGRGDSAGRTGFSRSYQKVYERPITNEEVRRRLGVMGPAHFVATNEKLIEHYAPAWILAERWPIAPQR